MTAIITPWTDEQNRLLEQLCGKKLLAEQIAAQINRRTGSHFTRNSVIGRAKRARAKLPVVAGSHGPRVKFRDAPPPEPKLPPEPKPPEPKPPRFKPGRLLMRLGWLDGG